jgi:putative copper resistance protein D
MVATLLQADLATWLSILIKAAAYGASLLAAGGALVLSSLPMLSAGAARSLVRTTLRCALLAAFFSLLRVPLRASFLMGGTWAGAMDPMILQMVAETPLGHSVWLRLLGIVLIFPLVWQTPVARAVAVCGAVLIAVSFALRGHSLEEPRLLLAALVVLHVLGLAFWLGALAPLARAARQDPPSQAGALARAFGQRAVWTVGALVAAGGLLLALLGGFSSSALDSPYGQLFALKLVAFSGILGFAAWNKMRLTPRLLKGEPTAQMALRRSIQWETSLFVAILLLTATTTTLTSPPGF